MLAYAEAFINGALLGGLYAVIGIGLSMVFGIMKQLNLAHGELMILACYFSHVTLQVSGLNPFLTFLAVLPAMFMIGYVIQKALLNKVLDKGMEPFLMISFGLSIILQNIMLLAFTPDARSLKSDLLIKSLDVFGLFRLPLISLMNFFVGSFVFIMLQLLMKKTYLGWAITAAGDDLNAARLMGINPKKVYCVAMGIASVTAAISGVLVGLTFTFYPHSGTQYLIIAFAVVIVGGLGSLPGTFLGGLILGVSQLLGARIFGPGFQSLSGYLILLLVLTLRPQGILGKR